MNDGNDEFDSKLEALFRREHAHLPAEPFSSATLLLIAAERRRAGLRTCVRQAAAVAAVVLLSPQLIDASVWVSARLDGAFVLIGEWLDSPAGLSAAVLCALAALAAKRARIW